MRMRFGSLWYWVLWVSLDAVSAAQSVRLNDPLRDQPEGNVASFRIVPGATRVVFRGDLSASSSSAELYCAPADGSAPPLELGTSLLSGLLRNYTPTADGSHVVFVNRSPDLTQHVYRLPLTGGTPLLLSGTVDADDFVLDPSGTHVVFRARDGLSLWSAPTDASSAPVRLSDTADGGIELDYAISPDGAWVVFRPSDASGEIDLHSAPIDGTAPARRLNLPRPLADVVDFQIAFDSLGVVYRADQDTDDRFELYAVEIDGSTAPLKRSAAVPTGSVTYFQLAASSDRLVFLVQEATSSELCSVSAIAGGTPLRLASMPTRPPGEFDLVLTAGGTRAVYRAFPDGLRGLYSVLTDGSAPAVRLNPGQATKSEDDAVAIVESAGRVLYVSDPVSLYSVPVDGSQAPVRLHAALPSGAELQMHGVMPDGSALYTSDDPMVGHYRAYRVAIDGSSAPVALTPGLPSGAFVSTLTQDVVAAGTGRVVYLRRGWADEVFSVSALGGPSVRLAPLPPGPIGGAVSQVQVTRDGARAVFLAEEYPAFQRDLHGATTDGSGPSLELNAPIGPGTGIQSFALSADGEWAVYRLANFTSELHAARTALRGHDVRLDRAPVPDDQGVGDFAIAPDSQRVIFAATNSTTSAIYSTSIDGLKAPVLLFTNPAGIAIHFTLSPDGAWVLFKAPGTQVLKSLPVDGHEGPVVLDGAPVLLGSTAFTADSKRVVYLAQRAGFPVQLHSVLVDGSLPALTLADTVQFTSFRLAPDGTRAVFAWADSAVHRALYSVPVDGSQAAVQINLTSTAYTVFDAYQIDPTSSRVVYATKEEQNVIAELYSAPIDGSAPRIKLSGELLSGQNVASFAGDPFRITADGRVVHAVSDTVGRQSLRIVPIDGSGPPLVLSLAQPSILELDARGESALFIDGADALRRVPLDGSEVPEILAPARVLSFQFCADGEHVVYGADHGDLMIELFSAFLERPKRRSGAPAGLR